MSVIEKIKSRYPLPIAKLHEEMRLESESRARMGKLLNLFEGTSQYLALVGLSIYIHQNLFDIEVEKARLGIARPSLGIWIGLLRSLSKCLSTNDPGFLTANPKHEYKNEPIGIAIKAIRDVVGLGQSNNMRLQGFLDTMVEFRNKKKGHGDLLSTEADKLLTYLEGAINQWLDDLTILYERNLLYISDVKLQKKKPVYFGTQLNTGASLESFQSEGEVDLDDKCVYLHLPADHIYVPLSPFLVYNPSIQVLYMYYDLPDDHSEVRLRRPYTAHGTDEWLKMPVDKMLILGSTLGANSTDSHLSGIKATPPSTFKPVEMSNVEIRSSPLPKVPANENVLSNPSSFVKNNFDDAIPPVNMKDVDSSQPTSERELIQRKKDNFQKSWDGLQNKIENLREEWINSSIIDRDRISNEIKKTETQQAEIEPRLNELSAKLEKINESQSQRVTQKLRHQADVEQASQTLSSLVGWMMQEPRVHAVMVRSRDNFNRTRKQIDIMRSYKNIHDGLHELESKCFNMISPEVSRFPHKSNLDNLSFYSQVLPDVKNRIQEYAKRSSLSQIEDLLADLGEAEQTLTDALTALDRTLFITAVRRIEHILHYDLSKINRLLVQSAKSLSLPDMIDSMIQVREHLVRHGIGLADIQTIDEGIQSLRNLSDSLIISTEEHGHWQYINDELFMAESDLQSAIDRWTRNKKLLDSLCGDGAEDFEKHIKKLCEDLDKAIEKAESTKNLQELFKTCNKRVGRRFEQIDGYLKDLCDEVKNLEAPITSIVNQMI